MTLEQRAADFARQWYSRPASGCDEETLVFYILEELRKQDCLSRSSERARLLEKISKFITEP